MYKALNGNEEKNSQTSKNCDVFGKRDYEEDLCMPVAKRRKTRRLELEPVVHDKVLKCKEQREKGHVRRQRVSEVLEVEELTSALASAIFFEPERTLKPQLVSPFYQLGTIGEANVHCRTNEAEKPASNTVEREVWSPKCTLKHHLVSPFYQIGAIGEANFHCVLESGDVPHSMTTSLIGSLLWKKILAGDFNREIVDKIELASLAFVSLSKSTDLTHFLANLMLVIRNLTGVSFANKIYDIFVEVLDLSSGDVEPHSADECDWLEVLKTCADNWQMAVNNPAFGKISSLLTMGVALGLCDPVNITLGKMQVFTTAVQQEHVNATSLIDATFQTAIFLCESGLAAWEQGSFTPFLFTNDNARNLDERFAEVMSLFEYAIPGNLAEMNMSQGDFEEKLDQLLRDLALARDTLRSGMEKRILSEKYIRLKSKQAAYMQTRASGIMRMRPYSFFITGGSSLGKTDIATILTQACGHYVNVNVGPERCYTYNAEDSYLSGYKSYMTVFRFDDFANTKATHVGIAPTTMLVKVINNNVEIAVMPDLESKGTVRIEPTFVTVTSNIMDLDAKTYSNCPASVLSRGNVHIVPTVKPQFRKDGSSGIDSKKVNDFYRNRETGEIEQPAIPDIWDVDVYVARIDEQRGKLTGNGTYANEMQQVTFEHIVHNGKPMKGVSMLEVVEYCVQDCKEFFESQKDMLRRARGDQMEFCKCCRKPTQLCGGCDVVPHSILSPLGKTVTCMSLSQWRKRRAKDSVKERWRDLFDRTSGWTSRLIKRGMKAASFDALSYATYLEYIVEEAATEKVVAIARDISVSRWGKWTTYLPKSWFDNPATRKALVASRVMTMHGDYLDVIGRRLTSPMAMAWYAALGCMGYCYKMPMFAAGLAGMTGLYHVYWYLAKLFFIKEVAEARLVEEHDGCPELFKLTRDRYASTIVGGVAAVGTFYAMYKLFKNLEITHGEEPTTPQATLEPKTVEDLNKRDEEDNTWQKVEHERILPMKRCANVDQAKDIVKPHSVWMRCEGLKSCALIVQSNVVMIPGHVVNQIRKRVKNPNVEMTFLRRSIDNANSTFRKIINLDRVVRVGEHDLFLVNVDTTGSVRGVLDLFPDETPMQLANAHYLGRTEDGSIREDVVTDCKFGVTANGVYDAGFLGNNLRRFSGMTYNFASMNSEVGMCTGVLIADKRTPYIAGLHLGGKNDPSKRRWGVAGTPMREEIDAALKELFADPTHFQAAQASDRMSSYGVDYLTGEETHPKSPLNFLKEGNFMSYGPCGGTTTFNSSVVQSPISESVTEQFGVPNMWGPPKGKGPTGKEPWHPWRTSLAISANPSIGVPEDLLEKAMNDYKRPLIQELRKHSKYYESEFRPLTEIEIVSGKDGKRFIDAMNMASAKGFPLKGKKAEDLIFLPPDLEHACPRTFKKVHWVMYEEWKRYAQSGMRGNLVFKASLKDEATLSIKTKVRVFQAAGMTLQLGMRQMFLPAARFLSQHPVLSECAVGVNAHGPEMHQLFQRIRKFGSKRGYAGDYSKYDLRMPAQLIYAAFQIMIDLSRECGEFTDDDEKLMRVLATEVACPMTAYNGDLIQFIGSNPSGQNLTAYINSVVNSLLHRCAFFEKYSDGYDFRKYVALMTYGDDFAGSVSSWLKYGNLDFADFCKRHDMVVTSPDKETELTQYMDCDKLDFLKRRPRWDAELGVYMGALDENSIYKSLHCNLQSKSETQQSVAASACSSALSEWFLHGREVYEDRVAKLRKTCNECGIASMVHGLFLSYDQRKENWMKKYGDDLEYVRRSRSFF